MDFLTEQVPIEKLLNFEQDLSAVYFFKDYTINLTRIS